MTRTLRPLPFAACMLASVLAVPMSAQAPAAPPQGGRGGGRGAQQPQVVSPEVTADRRIVFRIAAPQATAVRLNASDIPAPALGQAAQLTKKDNGVWETTTGQVPAGAYRYTFNIDGVATIDPRNPLTSESQNNSWSLVHVPGADFLDTRQVPHGNIAAVNYYSTALKADRRMHVYMPPGYETSSQKYPVFYLLHGAGDSDDSWGTVGRAGFILDNLINDKKAKPMIVVMPAGHTRGPAAAIGASATDAFISDFVTDIVPYVQKNYRALTDRPNTALAGLSMGGLQTLNIGIPNLEKFGYLGVYSSGLIGAFPGAGRGAPAPAAASSGPTEWETRNAAKLDDANLKKGLKLLWFSTGKEDFLLDTTVKTVDMLKKHGFTVVYKESDGGHTWLNWRDYLNEFAPQLFQ
jgi:enterochelin esterase-like enzyme